MSPDCEQALNQIKKWIETCTKEHASCKSVSSSRPLPKRVLDVQDSLLYPKKVFLYEPESDEMGSYTALSHCWGDQTTKPLLKTTRSTMRSHQRGITCLGLSKTFRDAIAITQKLGIRYLWIDSLCIIQDDQEDWELEATKMSSVYGNAYLVLAATAAADGDVGCFFPRPNFREVKVFKNTILARIYPGEDHHYFAIGRSPRPPLFSRAWACQERLLATRTLNFCTKEMVWECKAATWCECQSDAWELGSRAKPTIKEVINKFSRGGQNPYEAIQAWARVLRVFSRCALTHDSDRLPAFASLAAHFAASAKLGQYFAGLWEEFLIDGLQWRVTNALLGPQQEPSRRPSTYCAPSWSWASVASASIGPPHWYIFGQEFIGHTQRAKIISVDCVLSNSEALFGAVSSAELSIRGVLIPATFDPAKSKIRDFGYNATLDLKGDLIVVDFDVRISGTEAETYYCFWLDTSYWPGNPGPREEEHILILEKNADPRCTYRRVGILSLVQKDLSKRWFEEASKEKEETITIL